MRNKSAQLIIVIFIVFYLIFNGFIALMRINYLSQSIKKENNEVNLDTLYESNLLEFDFGLYSEQINVKVGGESSLIEQSLFTNLTSLLRIFGFNKMVFEDSAVFLVSSNSHEPNIYPIEYSSDTLAERVFYNFGKLEGIITYNESEVHLSEINGKTNEIITHLKESLKVEIFVESSGDPYVIPIYSVAPNFTEVVPEMLEKIPQDGYFDIFDENRTLSEEYMNDKYFRIISVYSSSMDMLLDLMEKTIEYLGVDLQLFEDLFTFDIENMLSFINESEYYDDLMVLEGYNNTMIEGYIDEFLIDPDIELNLESFNIDQLYDLFDSKLMYLSFAYEGNEEGVESKGSNEYSMDLRKILNYDDSEKIDPSSKAILSIFGCLLSFFTIEIVSPIITSYSPAYYTFNEKLLDKLTLYSEISGLNFNFSKLADYDLEISSWEYDGHSVSPYTTLKNYDNISDYINYLYYIGFPGLAMIPTGIIDPYFNLEAEYELLTHKPIISIEREIDDPTYNPLGIYNMTIKLRNLGGVPTSKAYGINASIYIESVGTISRNIFLIDANGDGIVDNFYPTLNLLAPWGDNILNPNSGVINPFSTPKEIKIPYVPINLIYNTTKSENFTSSPAPEPLVGNQLDSTTYANALENDDSCWNISTSEQSGRHLIQLNFNFLNSSLYSESERGQINGLNIESFFTLNNSLNGEIMFSLLNHSSQKYEFNYTFNNLSRTNGFDLPLINEADDIFSYPNKSSMELYNVSLIIFINSSNPLKMALNDINLKLIHFEPSYIGPAKVIYTDEYFINKYTAYSGSDYINTVNLPNLKVNSSLSAHQTNVGTLTRYNITISNVGDETAKNINISTFIPGVLVDYESSPYNFSIEGSTITGNVSEILPGEIVSDISFDFLAPNDERIPNCVVGYDNDVKIRDFNISDFTSLTNPILLSAPIDFKTKSPEVQEVELKIAINNSAPYPGDQIKLNITIENVGDYDIEKYYLYWFNTPKTILPTIEGVFVDNNLLEINSIGANTSKSIQIIVNKTNFMGYLLMIPHFLASILNNPTISIRSSILDVLVVGEISFLIEKIVSNTIVFQGDLISILVKVNNTGTIPFGNFSIQERTTISSSDFEYLGNESYFIGVLNPNEVISFTITLIPKQWIGNSQISESTLPLYTPYYTEFLSNELAITNLINKFLLILMIIVPVGIVAVVLVKRFILNPRREVVEL